MANLSLSMTSGGEALGALEMMLPGKALSAEEQVIELFDEMRLPLLRHLMWLNLSAEQAEDVVQESFLRLFQHLSRADSSRQNLRGWVWRVAHNLGLNLRVADNRKVKGREMALEEVQNWLADPGLDPEQALRQREGETSLEKGMLLLNERDKQCFHLRLQGMGYRQIGSVLGIGRSTVSDAMERVVTILRRCYTHS